MYVVSTQADELMLFLENYLNYTDIDTINTIGIYYILTETWHILDDCTRFLIKMCIFLQKNVIK